MVTKEKIYLYLKDPKIVFGILSCFFILLNIFTISWTPLPWFDEVWFIDTSVNSALDNTWTTTAQVSYGGETPIALYPPLYQYLLTLWIKICGFSITSVRSFNVVIAAISSIVLFQGLRELGYLKNKWIILVFVFLFWGTGLFAWSYRNGRPDMVNMLCALSFMYSYFLYVKKGYSKWLMFFSAILVVLSGLQSCPLIIVFLIYLYVIKGEYRHKTKAAFFVTILGLVLGTILLWGHFLFHEHPKSFFWQFSVSQSISNILYKIPFLSEYIQPMKKIPEEGKDIFREFIDCYVKNKNYAIFTLVNSGILFAFRKKMSSSSIEIYFLGFSVLMPTVMFFAGHCLSPYTWMFYFPAIIFAVICLEKYNNKFLWIIYGGLTFLFTVILGLPRMLLNNEKKEYDKIVEFVERQNFDENVVILSYYKAYYPVRKITRNSYYPMYPVQYMPSNIQYILIDETDSFGHENDDVYISNIRNEGKQIVAIDSLNNPRVILYEVQ